LAQALDLLMEQTFRDKLIELLTSIAVSLDGIDGELNEMNERLGHDGDGRPVRVEWRH
jgi:hypothetical protein